MKKKILLMGGHSKARTLASSLIKQGYAVTAVNDCYADALELAEIQGLTVIHGDATKPYILSEAGADEADISIALSSKDEDNLVASELCKTEFHVKKTVSVVSDPRKTKFFYQCGVDSVICATATISAIIEQQAFIDQITNIIPFGEGRIQIVEVRIPETSPVAGKKLWEVTLPREVIIGCIMRGNTNLIPRGDTRVLAGDMLVVLAESGQEMEAIQALTGR